MLSLVSRKAKMPNQLGVRLWMSAGLVLAGCSALGLAQVSTHRVGRQIDERLAVTLEGNVHPLARAEFDRGPAGADTRLERMMLVLKPSVSQQAELDAMVGAQHDPQSPFYHRWITPTEFGARFGVSAQEMAQVTGWLAGHGFEVNEIPVSNRLRCIWNTANDFCSDGDAAARTGFERRFQRDYSG
jgi:hypothetical protein